MVVLARPGALARNKGKTGNAGKHKQNTGKNLATVRKSGNLRYCFSDFSLFVWPRLLAEPGLPLGLVARFPRFPCCGFIFSCVLLVFSCISCFSCVYGQALRPGETCQESKQRSWLGQEACQKHRKCRKTQAKRKKKSSHS